MSPFQVATHSIGEVMHASDVYVHVRTTDGLSRISFHPELGTYFEAVGDETFLWTKIGDRLDARTPDIVKTHPMSPSMPDTECWEQVDQYPNVDDPFIDVDIFI